ncbi:hypothetical protein AB0L53_53065 [Nonomuraea sp. NPDC052129]|uniref:hypothetical protein n=1 Tax=Nonomuraea sp. NPDC052129 TaxID=3154651 RepID=UPI00341348E3
MDVTRSPTGSRSWAVPWPVWLVAGLMVAGLLSLSGAYGFHGDEMYFAVAGRHPAFGYVDQPPLTPLLSAASVAILGPRRRRCGSCRRWRWPRS